MCTAVEAAEGSMAHNGWSERNGIKRMKTMCWMHLITFRLSHYHEYVLPIFKVSPTSCGVQLRYYTP